MSLTAAQFENFYSEVTLGASPSVAEQSDMVGWAAETSLGQLTADAAAGDVLGLVEADGLTNVALAAYQFFTGSVPSAAGLSFLVASPGNGGNSFSLASSYYSSFDTENRFFNFSLALAFSSSGAGAFAAAYGPLSFAQAVSQAYETIVSSAVVGAAAAAAAEAAIAAEQPYFAAVAAEVAPGADPDLAAKAVMVGYVLEEALKSDVGALANAVYAFDANLGAGALGLAGAPSFGGDLLAPSVNLLTPASDAIVLAGNGETANVVNAPGSLALASGGGVTGQGAGETLVITDVVAGTAGASASLVIPAGFAVSGVQTEYVTTSGTFGSSSAPSGAQSFVGQAGLQSLNLAEQDLAGLGLASVAVSDGTALTLKAAPTDVVSVFGGGVVDVVGGSQIFVSGDALSSVTVTGETGPVSISNDAPQGAGLGQTLTSVTLNGWGGGAVISADGLQSLTLMGDYGNTIAVKGPTSLLVSLEAVGLDSQGNAAPDTLSSPTLTQLTLDTLSASEVGVSGASLSVLTLEGSAAVTVTAIPQTLSLVDGSNDPGGFVLFDTAPHASVRGEGGAVVVLETALTSGAAISLGGSGDTVQAGPGGAIGPGVVVDGGSGVGNMISASLITAANAANIHDFEILDLDGFGASAGDGPLNVSTIASPIFAFNIFQGASGLATLTGLPASVFGAALGGASSVNLTHAAGPLTLDLGESFGSGLDTGPVALQLASSGDTTASIISAGLGPNQLSLTEAGNSLTSVTVQGGALLEMMGGTPPVNATSPIAADDGITTGAPGASALTLIDASQTTGGIDIYAGAPSGSGAGATTYTGLTILGGSGGDLIDNAADNGVVTEGATPSTLVNTVEVSGAGAVVNDQASAGADAIFLNSLKGGEIARLGSGAAVVTAGAIGTVGLTAGAGAFDEVVYGSVKGQVVVDDIQYGVVASGVSASAQGNYLLLANVHCQILAFAQPALNASALGTPVDVSAAKSLDQAVFIAEGGVPGASGHTVGPGGMVSWFQWNGDTYLVETGPTGAGTTAASELVKIAGLVSLSHSTFSQGELTFA